MRGSKLATRKNENTDTDYMIDLLEADLYHLIKRTDATIDTSSSSFLKKFQSTSNSTSHKKMNTHTRLSKP